MPKQKRDNIFVWPSWISKLVAGESQCEYQYWLKAHYLLDKRPSDFNLAKWTIEHNQLMRSRREALEQLGFTVYVEDQNAFKLVINNVTISGKADIVAISQEDNLYLVEDCKTGQPKTSDHVQVILYMILLPKAIEKYKNIEFNGCIIYKLGIPNVNIPIKATQDESLKRIIWDTIKRIAGSENECRKNPSFNECKKCDICKVDCQERIE